MDSAPRSKPKYRKLPAPSKLNLSPEPFPDAPPGFVIRAAIALRRFLQGLADRVAPPEAILLDQMTGFGVSMLLGAVARHDIAGLLDERGPLTAAAIAEARGLDADATHRTLRALAANGTFEMLSDGSFANNRVSRALRSGQSSRMRECSLYFASGSNVAAWADYAHGLETGKSPFRAVHDASIWEWFDEHPDERENFAHAMMGFTVMSASAIAAIYPFDEVRRLCDVGGGRGTLLSEVLLRHPHLRAVLADASGVLESARELLGGRGVLERVELAPSSFFERVPEGCDAYILKNVLHDWDDEVCKKILRVVRQAMKPGDRVILCEALVDAGSRDRTHTTIDLQMLVACEEGRERSLGELRRLLEATGFRHTRLFPFPVVSVVEGEAI